MVAPRFRATALRSGSSGNALFIEGAEGALLLDCGINGKQLRLSLAELGLPEDQIRERIKGIVISHEHSDHISGLGVLLRRYHLPFYMTEASFIKARPRLGRIDESLWRPIAAGEPFEVGGLHIDSCELSHDAAMTLGFSIQQRGRKISVLTDLGVFDERAYALAEGSDLVFLEANYGEDLLWSGPYPYALKERVASKKGHLSNEAAGQAALQLIATGCRELVLSHLSEDNNHPRLAIATVEEALAVSRAKRGSDYCIQVARRYACSRPCDLF